MSLQGQQPMPAYYDNFEAHPPPKMDLYRSQSMRYVQITMPTDAAHLTVSALGEFGKLHIVDLADGEPSSKQYMMYKKRAIDCNYWLKKLAFLKELCNDYKISQTSLDSQFDIQRDTSNESADVLHEIKEYLDPLETEILQSSVVLKENTQDVYQCLQYAHVLQVVQDLDVPMFDDGKGMEDHSDEEEARSRQARIPSLDKPLLIELNHKIEDKQSVLIAGMLELSKIGVFQRMMYRISRGNAYVQFVTIPGLITNPSTGEQVQKAVFYTFCTSETLAQRVRKLCTMLEADVYPIPADPRDFASKIASLNQERRDKESLHEKTKLHIVNVLHRLVAGDAELANERKLVKRGMAEWVDVMRREQATCAAFMKCHFYLTMICLEGWCIESSLNELRSTLNRAVEGRGLNAAMLEVDPINAVFPDALHSMPPTYFPSTKITSVFQKIVDTYGVPRYQEVNPGLFTIVTFPFLFGVMYGDIGHGLLLFCFGLYMCWNEKYYLAQQKAGKMGEMFGMAFGGRWVLLPMGFFAVYCGFIYNDCMSNPIPLFKSSWSLTENGEWVSDGSVYPFGVDPEWYHKDNELMFMNGLKMKMAILLGVIHMMFGIFLSFSNHHHKGDKVSIWCDFLPRLLFMSVTFGYMCFLIVYKWTQDYYGDVDNPGLPPNLIQVMIGMFLPPFAVTKELRLYEGQKTVQVLFVTLAFLLIPLMLFAKPCILRAQDNEAKRNRRENRSSSVHQHVLAEDSDLADAEDALDHKSHDSINSGGHGHGKDFDFGAESIHQAIHTIEFVLGCVSNTASYLRLWALSLAHSQLAQVFWDMALMQYGIDLKNPVAIVVGTAVWAAATAGVLLGMDVLECFLHALRLHWVEFQNKFFYADGYAFQPFTFKQEEEQE